MPRFLKKAAAWSALAAAVWLLWPESPLRHAPGLRVEDEPVQVLIPTRGLCQVHGYSLSAVATYALSARVLHTKHYWADGNDLVPYDVALGWGPMSDQAILDRLTISQGNRFFFYQWQNTPPLPVEEIVAHCSNNHLIAASEEVAAKIRRLRVGEFVQMRGFLVNATRPDGFHWNTSLSRTDTGNGACELFYVEAISVGAEPG